VLASIGTFEQLYTGVIFTGWIFYAAAALAVVILRRKRPQWARPYRVYTVLPVAFAAAALIIIINALARNPRESGIGLGLVLLGIPVYFVWTRVGQRQQIA
jgi:APA family basic amino acid/polyamine antiporter